MGDVQWTHGNALVVEDPDGVSVRRRGWGTELTFADPTGGTDAPARVCHVPLGVSAPGSAGGPTAVEGLVVLFDASPGVWLTELDLWHGEDLVATVVCVDPPVGGVEPRPGWTGVGDQRRPGPHNRVALTAPLTVRHGLSLSVHVLVHPLVDPGPAPTLLVQSVGVVVGATAGDGGGAGRGDGNEAAAPAPAG